MILWVFVTFGDNGRCQAGCDGGMVTARGGAQVMAGDQHLPTRVHLQDALLEECHAGPSIALALQEFQPMDSAFGDAVAPLESEPRDDGPQVVLEPAGEASQGHDPTVDGLRHPGLQGLTPMLPDARQQGLAPCIRARNPSERAYDYLRSQLTMDHQRNFANIARQMTGDDGQALQHFMSNAPWSGPAVFDHLHAEIKATPALAQGSTLILDESADEKAGTHTAGASRQDNGRLGKVEVCQVDTCLTSANGGLWAMVDGELFLPEDRKSGLGRPSPRPAKHWASRRTARSRPRSPWA